MLVEEYEFTEEKAEFENLHVKKIKIVEERDQLAKQMKEERLRWILSN